jgi:UDP-glucose 6-dehydrogenase
MEVSVFGLGYVGCVTAACLAKAGHRVIGVDVNVEKVAMVNAGVAPVVEPGLGELLAEVVQGGQLVATTSAPVWAMSAALRAPMASESSWCVSENDPAPPQQREGSRI